jgi:hypothetical protein
MQRIFLGKIVDAPICGEVLKAFHPSVYIKLRSRESNQCREYIYRIILAERILAGLLTSDRLLKK